MFSSLPLRSQHPDWPAYSSVSAAFDRNEPGILLDLSAELACSKNSRDRDLGILALSAGLFRKDDLLGCTRALDSLDRSLPSADPFLRATGMRIRSMLMTQVGSPSKGVGAAEAGLAIVRGKGWAEEEVPLLVVKAEALTELNDLNEAMRVLSVAQRRTEESGFLRGRCLVLVALGNVKYKQGRYAEAKKDYTTAFEIGSRSRFNKVAESALGNLAGVAAMEGDNTGALKLYDSLLTILGDRSPEFRARLIGQKGYVLIEQGEFRTAIAECLRSVAIADSIGDLRSKADALHDIAFAQWSLGDRAQGSATMDSALSAYARLGWRDRIRWAHWDLAEWYHGSGEDNAAFKHLLRYSSLSDSINSERFTEQLARSEVLFETERKERRIAEQDQDLAIAAEQDRRKSTQRNAFIGATALLALIALLLYRSMRNKQRLAKQEKELHDEQVDQLLSQQEMRSINAMLEGQEKERERVGKELHDHVGSLLGAIKHQLGVLEEQVADVKTEQTAQYHKVSGLLDNAAGELRRISHDMAAATLNRFGLEKALQDLRDTLHINGRLQVELNTFGMEQPLQRGVEIAVYRIIQEAVSNVLKHAKATELSIGVTHAPGRLSVLVSDNGSGFDTAVTSGGMGLANIRTRAAALGAQVQIDSTPGKGTTVSVECPVVE